MSRKGGPLTGVRILDLGRIMAAPWATQLLADLGAEVIKIERPGIGDDTRSWGPPFANADGTDGSGESGYFLSVNRGKRSVEVDISSPDGQEIIRKIAAKSDVVIENFRPGGLKKYGLDAVGLQQVNPKLIYCSVTGFGQSGPRRDEAAYDFAIQAMGGLMSVTGEADSLPGGGPQKVGIPIIDLMTGMYAAVAILAALNGRTQSGQGEVIDLAMLDVSAAILANQAMNYLLTQKAPVRRGNSHPNIQPQDIFPCGSSFLALAVGNDAQFAKLCNVLGREEWAADPKYATNRARVENVDDLRGQLVEAFSQWDRTDLLIALGKAGVPCAAVNTIEELFAEPQIQHREMLQNLPHASLGSVPQVVSPMKFSNASLNFEKAPPTLGQDSHKVLQELGIEIEPKN